MAKGLAENEWKINGNVDDMTNDIIFKYADDRKALTEKEAAFFILETVYEYGTYACKNCLQKIREEINGFFQFLDCDEKRFVQAVNLYTVGKKFTAGDRLKTTDVNDWLLKEDHRGIGRLDFKQFQHAVLRTLYELNYLTAASASPAPSSDAAPAPSSDAAPAPTTDAAPAPALDAAPAPPSI